jgi:hypothetical protein
MRHQLNDNEKACFLVEISEKVYKVDPLSKARFRMMVYARSAITIQLVADGETYEAIGAFFDKDHASVYYAIKKHPDWLKFDRDYREHYNNFLLEIGKPGNQEKYILEEIKAQIIQINIKLSKLNYDSERISEFWEEIVLDVRKKHSA